jgi:hypothetical protein
VPAKAGPVGRRWTPLAAGVAVLAAAAVLVALASLAAAARTRRQALPWTAVEGARAALHRARVEAAAEPDLARAVAAGELLERRLAEAEGARLPGIAAVLAGPEIERLADEAQAAARQALRSAWTRERQGREEIVVRGAEIADKLAALGGELERVAADRRLRAVYQRAGLEAQAAGAAGRRGDLGAATTELESAGRDLAAVEERLSAHHARLRDPVLLARWQRWVDETVAASRAEGSRAVVVEKLERRCELLDGGRIVASWPAELGRNGLAAKLYAGDAATPEGRYRVVEKRDLGATTFHRALLLDYPSAEDLRLFEESRRLGRVPAGRGAGGSIEIHGHGGKWINWTNGCIALRDAHIDDLFAAVEVGTPVTIVGTAPRGVAGGPPATGEGSEAEAGRESQPRGEVRPHGQGHSRGEDRSKGEARSHAEVRQR